MASSEQQQLARVDEWNPQAHRTTRAWPEANGKNKHVNFFSFCILVYLKSTEQHALV